MRVSIMRDSWHRDWFWTDEESYEFADRVVDIPDDMMRDYQDAMARLESAIDRIDQHLKKTD